MFWEDSLSGTTMTGGMSAAVRSSGNSTKATLDVGGDFEGVFFVVTIAKIVVGNFKRSMEGLLIRTSFSIFCVN